MQARHVRVRCLRLLAFMTLAWAWLLCLPPVWGADANTAQYRLTRADLLAGVVLEARRWQPDYRAKVGQAQALVVAGSSVRERVLAHSSPGRSSFLGAWLAHPQARAIVAGPFAVAGTRHWRDVLLIPLPENAASLIGKQPPSELAEVHFIVLSAERDPTDLWRASVTVNPPVLGATLADAGGARPEWMQRSCPLLVQRRGSRYNREECPCSEIVLDSALVSTTLDCPEPRRLQDRCTVPVCPVAVANPPVLLPTCPPYCPDPPPDVKDSPLAALRAESAGTDSRYLDRRWLEQLPIGFDLGKG